jgi:hypothetical protein
MSVLSGVTKPKADLAMLYMNSFKKPFTNELQNAYGNQQIELRPTFSKKSNQGKADHLKLEMPFNDIKKGWRREAAQIILDGTFLAKEQATHNVI